MADNTQEEEAAVDPVEQYWPGVEAAEAYSPATPGNGGGPSQITHDTAKAVWDSHPELHDAYPDMDDDASAADLKNRAGQDEDFSRSLGKAYYGDALKKADGNPLQALAYYNSGNSSDLKKSDADILANGGSGDAHPGYFRTFVNTTGYQPSVEESGSQVTKSPDDETARGSDVPLSKNEAVREAVNAEKTGQPSLLSNAAAGGKAIGGALSAGWNAPGDFADKVGAGLSSLWENAPAPATASSPASPDDIDWVAKHAAPANMVNGQVPSSNNQSSATPPNNGLPMESLEENGLDENGNPLPPAQPPLGSPQAYSNAVESEKSAVGAMAEPQAAAASTAADVQGTEEGQLEALDAGTQAREDAFNQNYGTALAKLQSQQVDPFHWQKSIGPVGNIISALAQAMGAYGAAITHSPNFATEIINGYIDRDMNAQLANRNNQVQIMNFMREHNLDLNQFDNLHRISLLDQTQVALSQLQNQTTSATVKLQTANVQAQLEVEKQQAMIQMNARAMQMQYELGKTRQMQMFELQKSGALTPEEEREMGALNEADSSLNRVEAKVGGSTTIQRMVGHTADEFANVVPGGVIPQFNTLDNETKNDRLMFVKGIANSGGSPRPLTEKEAKDKDADTFGFSGTDPLFYNRMKQARTDLEERKSMFIAKHNARVASLYGQSPTSPVQQNHQVIQFTPINNPGMK